jgi:hypothetical protein
MVCLWVASVCRGSERLHAQAAREGSWPPWRIFSDVESQSATHNDWVRDALFVGILPRRTLLWMRLH